MFSHVIQIWRATMTAVWSSAIPHLSQICLHAPSPKMVCLLQQVSFVTVLYVMLKILHLWTSYVMKLTFFFFFFFFISWTTGCVCCRCQADVRRCTRAPCVSDTHLHSDWHHRLQTCSGGSCISWQVGNDGGIRSAFIVLDLVFFLYAVCTFVWYSALQMGFSGF